MRTGWTSSNRGAAAVLAAAALVAVAVAVAGCTAGSAAVMRAAAPTASAAGSNAAASPRASAAARGGGGDTPLAPLTGLPAGSTQAAGRAAVALALSGSHPQGIGSADLVYEEMTRPVRYIAVFQSREASVAGPVTATRPADAQALSVLHPLTAYDGGTPSFVRVLDQSRVVDVGYARYPSLYHAGAQGLTVSTSQIRQAARDTAPPQMLTYRGTGAGTEENFASTGTWRASSLRIAAPGQAAQTWRFDARSHLWRQVSGGPPVQVANVVMQRVPYKTVFVSRKYGLTTTSARVIGSGSALMLSEPAAGSAGAGSAGAGSAGAGSAGAGSAGTASAGAGSAGAGSAGAGSAGTAARGTWSKPGLRDVTTYLDASGRPVGFQPGATWVILAPPGTRLSTAGSGS